MRRIVLALVAFIVAAYLVATWYMGKTGQERIEEYVSQLNQEISSQWASDDKPPQLKIIDYKRGITSSLITYQLIFNPDDEKPDTALILDHLSHGPWPVAALKQGLLTPVAAYSNIKPLHGGAMQAWFDLIEGDGSPWKMTGIMRFNGAVNSEINFHKFADAESEFVFGGADFTVNYLPHTSKLEIDGNIESLSTPIPDADVVLNAQDLDWSSFTTHSDPSNIQAHQLLKAAYISFTLPEGNVVSARKTSFVNDSTYIGGLLDAQTDYDLGEILINDDSIGHMQLVLAANRIRYEALQNILVALDDSEPADGSGLGAAQQELFSNLSKLMAESPYISVEKLLWENNNDKSEFSTSLNFRPVDEDDISPIDSLIENSIDKYSLNFLLSKNMVFDILKVNMDDNTAAFISMLFDHYAARLERLGLIQVDGQKISGDLVYKDMLVTVNGKEMTLEHFVNRASSLL